VTKKIAGGVLAIVNDDVCTGPPRQDAPPRTYVHLAMTPEENAWLALAYSVPGETYLVFETGEIHTLFTGDVPPGR
jgi:hypothetical protein